MAIYRIDSAPVRDAVTGEFNTALVGQQVQIVTRDTTTPYPIEDAAGDPIPSSLLTVQTSFCVPRFYIDTATPTTVYLDWYDAASGARGPVSFEAVLREVAVSAEANSASSATSASASSAAATATAADVGALREWVEKGVTSRNVILDPRATVAANWSAVSAAATETMVTGATDGPTLPDGTNATTYARYTMTANPGSVNTSFGYQIPNENAGLWPSGTRLAAGIYVRSSVALPAAYPAVSQQIAASPWTESGAQRLTTAQTAIPANTWVRLADTFLSTVEAGAFGVRAFFLPSSSALLASGAVIEVTAALASPDQVAVIDHFDGDSPDTTYVGNAWSGTPNASVSERIEMKFVRSVNGIGPDSGGNVTIPTGGGGVTAHGSLSGLGGDDHLQYFNATRGDARYYTKEAAALLIAAANAASSTDDRKRENHTGTQPISTVTDLESRLQAAENSGSGITLLPEGTEPPAGSPVGIYAFIPGGEVPTTSIETVSYASTGTTVTCPVPTAAAVGDTLVFIPAFVSADTNITVSDTGWVEKIDYSGQQARKSGMYIYQVVDAAALSALGSTVTASIANPGVRGGAVVRISGALTATAWPTYSSGSNRSAATLNSATTTGFTVQSFATATVPFDRVMMWSIHDADNVPAAASGFTVLGHVSSSNAGATPITLTLFIKTHSTAPVPAAPVTFPTAASAVAGGGQFIVPAV